MCVWQVVIIIEGGGTPNCGQGAKPGARCIYTPWRAPVTGEAARRWSHTVATKGPEKTPWGELGAAGCAS